MPTISTLLVANRGEIARRIFRTARLMGIRTVAVYSEPDRDAPFVREADVAVALGGSTASESYLRINAIIDAARYSGADAVHPGYGFLSENADFARACSAAGLVFVGPTASNIDAMGGKIEAKRLAAAAGVPTLASAVLLGDDPDVWTTSAANVGYPVLVKASAGGGGKGMRIVASAAELADAVVGARREAAASFGDGTVFIERYLAAPRHIEIQVFADAHGNAVHLHERECSVQRRHQKIIEEAPSTAVSAELRARMGAASVDLVSSIGYLGAGTVEYLLDDDSGRFFFLEMNTRLQVEHPVTECITGADLVRWQLQVARGEALPLTQDQVELRGHAVEVRLYAEDPANGFLPTFGTLRRYDRGTTGGVRWDDGVETGSDVSTFYDPMLAKVIVHAPTRDEAAGRLRRALAESAIHGVVTNRDYLVAVLGDPDFLAGNTTTAYVGEHPDLLAAGVSAALRRLHLIAATLVSSRRRHRGDGPWGFAPTGWRNVFSQRQRVSYAVGDTTHSVAYMWSTPDTASVDVDGVDSAVRVVASQCVDADTEAVTLECDGLTTRVTVHVLGGPVSGPELGAVWVNSAGGQSALVELPRFADSATGASAAGPTAPVPGRVVAVEVSAGDLVEAGRTLVVMEAMKMEHRIEAAVDSIVGEVLCSVGDQVDAHQVLVVLEPVTR